MVRTLLDDGSPRDPQIAQLIDRSGVPVLTNKGLFAEVKLCVRHGKTPHLTLHHGNSRYRRLRQDGPGRWTYQELPLSARGWVRAGDGTDGPRPAQTWGPVN